MSTAPGVTSGQTGSCLTTAAPSAVTSATRTVIIKSTPQPTTAATAVSLMTSSSSNNTTATSLATAAPSSGSEMYQQNQTGSSNPTGNTAAAPSVSDLSKQLINEQELRRSLENRLKSLEMQAASVASNTATTTTVRNFFLYLLFRTSHIFVFWFLVFWSLLTFPLHQLKPNSKTQ